MMPCTTRRPGREKEDLLASVPGVGPAIARTFIAELPDSARAAGKVDKRAATFSSGYRQTPWFSSRCEPTIGDRKGSLLAPAINRFGNAIKTASPLSRLALAASSAKASRPSTTSSKLT